VGVRSSCCAAISHQSGRSGVSARTRLPLPAWWFRRRRSHPSSRRRSGVWAFGVGGPMSIIPTEHGRLVACGFPDLLKSCDGAHMVVSLLNDDACELLLPNDITYLRCDVDRKRARAFLPGYLEIVETALRRHRTVVVTCRQGTHRSGAFCVLVMAHAISSGEFREARGPSHQVISETGLHVVVSHLRGCSFCVEFGERGPQARGCPGFPCSRPARSGRGKSFGLAACPSYPLDV
jgi:protein-tyrosine phosphatase